MQYSDIYEYSNLYNAYLKARKQKRYRNEVLRFSYNLDRELLLLQKELKEKTYHIGAYRPFIVMEPKRRQIMALPFRDRVVQHAINNVIEGVFERRMIYDSYACRVGKGNHEAVRRVSYFMGKEENLYYLKMDVKSYFPSINIDILKQIIQRYIEDEDILWILDIIFKSSLVPGMPIGNLMSQLFANVYLHELDHHCKNVLGIKYYVRYMDDVLVFAQNKSYLHGVFADVEDFLRVNLKLELNHKTAIARCRDGIEFVGYRIWRGYKLIKKQSLQRMKKKVKAFKKGEVSEETFIASMGSWMGHSLNTSSYKGVMRIALDGMREMHRRVGNGPQSIAQGI